MRLYNSISEIYSSQSKAKKGQTNNLCGTNFPSCLYAPVRVIKKLNFLLLSVGAPVRRERRMYKYKGGVYELCEAALC